MAGSGMSLRDISDVAIDINTVVDESVLTFDSADKKFKARKLVASDVPVKALTDYANVVVVDAGGNGDYTTLSAALAAITDASATNRYGVVIMPGRYDVAGTALQIAKDGVDVMAFVPGTVEIYSSQAVAAGGIVVINPTATITEQISIIGLRIVQPAGIAAAAALYVGDASGTLAYNFNVVLRGCHIESKNADSASRVIVSNGMDINTVFTPRVDFVDCQIRHSGNGSHGIDNYYVGYLIFDNCRIGIQATAAGSIVVDTLNPFSDGAAWVRAYRCKIFGGAASFGNSNADSSGVSVAHCEMRTAISGATNNIATPYNVVDIDITF